MSTYFYVTLYTYMVRFCNILEHFQYFELAGILVVKLKQNDKFLFKLIAQFSAIFRRFLFNKDLN